MSRRTALRLYSRVRCKHIRAARLTAATVAARLRITDHGAAAVIDLGIFTVRGDDNNAGLATRAVPRVADEAFDALLAAGETVVIDQVLVNGLGVATGRGVYRRFRRAIELSDQRRIRRFDGQFPNRGDLARSPSPATAL